MGKTPQLMGLFTDYLYFQLVMRIQVLGYKGIVITI